MREGRLAARLRAFHPPATDDSGALSHDHQPALIISSHTSHQLKPNIKVSADTASPAQRGDGRRCVPTRPRALSPMRSDDDSGRRVSSGCAIKTVAAIGPPLSVHVDLLSGDCWVFIVGLRVTTRQSHTGSFSQETAAASGDPRAERELLPNDEPHSGPGLSLSFDPFLSPGSGTGTENMTP